MLNDDAREAKRRETIDQHRRMQHAAQVADALKVTDITKQAMIDYARDNASPLEDAFPEVSVRTLPIEFKVDHVSIDPQPSAMPGTGIVSVQRCTCIDANGECPIHDETRDYIGQGEIPKLEQAKVALAEAQVAIANVAMLIKEHQDGL